MLQCWCQAGQSGRIFAGGSAHPGILIWGQKESFSEVRLMEISGLLFPAVTLTVSASPSPSPFSDCGILGHP